MFYKMIERARDRWYSSSKCTVSDLTNYMVQQGHLRDAQIENTEKEIERLLKNQ